MTPTGTERVTREVPTLVKVGRIPLGPHHKGRNTFHYKLLVDGRPLAPGSYIVTLRSLNAKGQVLDLSQPVALTVDRHGRAFRKACARLALATSLVVVAVRVRVRLSRRRRRLERSGPRAAV